MVLMIGDGGPPISTLEVYLLRLEGGQSLQDSIQTQTLVQYNTTQYCCSHVQYAVQRVVLSTAAAMHSTPCAAVLHSTPC